MVIRRTSTAGAKDLSILMIDNKLLARQLKKAFHLDEVAQWEHAIAARLRDALTQNTPEAEATVQLFMEQMQFFISRIEASYEQYDRDLDLKQRSLELSSAELSEALARVQKICIIDSLTETFTRLHFQECLDSEFHRSRRHHCELSVVMIDLDHFKMVNDCHGHQAGDAVLQECARRIKAMIRREDTLGRYGGEEFLILAPETNREKAQLLAERLRVGIANKPISLGEKAITVTASFGISSFSADMQQAQELIRMADIALYEAKSHGRNCVMAA